MHKNEFLIIFQFFIFIQLCFARQIKLRKIISLNEIKLKITGGGNQTILSESLCFIDQMNHPFEQLPTEILVNDVPQEIIGKTVYNLSEGVNNVTMRWNYDLTNCNCMFSDLSNIISIDFFNFDTSKVTNMLYMFNVCH